MKIFCYDDQWEWGRKFAQSCAAIKLDTKLFRKLSDINCESYTPGDAAFVHVSNRPGGERLYTKQLITDLSGHDELLLIPRANGAAMFDDRVLQYKTFDTWMPETCLIERVGRALDVINKIKYPFVSKSRKGRNIRLIQTKREALREVQQVFSPDGMLVDSGDRQKDYLLWQKYIVNEGYKWQVFFLAQKYVVVTKVSRDGKKIIQMDALDNLLISILYFAAGFVSDMQLNWAAVDIMHEIDHEQQVRKCWIMGVSTDFPLEWFDRGGLIFRLGDKDAWYYTGIPASRIFNVAAAAALNGEFNVKSQKPPSVHDAGMVRMDPQMP